MKEKRKFEMPHTFVIILAIIVVASCDYCGSGNFDLDYPRRRVCPF